MPGSSGLVAAQGHAVACSMRLGRSIEGTSKERGPGVDQAEIIAIIEEGTHQRGWISNSYAQIEYLLGDLIIRCRAFPEYAEQTAIFTHSAPKRVKKVRSMLEIEGALTPYATEIVQVLDAFEANHEIRNLLAHGFCEFHHTPDNDAGFVFRKFERGDVQNGQDADIAIQRTFRLIDLQYHREQFVHQAQRALEVFSHVHHELGWGDLDPATLPDGWGHFEPAEQGD